MLWRMFKKKRTLVYRVEKADWVIKWVGRYITGNLPESLPAVLSPGVSRSWRNIIHYGSKHLFFSSSGFKKRSRFNKVVVSWFHVTPDDRTLEFVEPAMESIDFLHTSCRITADILKERGACPDKVIVIPLGVDTSLFTLVGPDKRRLIREKLNIPVGRVCVGSFQKDGVGWEEGLEPKLEKGPDILCDTLEILNEKFPVHVLLTGPARGYVKKRLHRASIPFTHCYLENYPDIVDYYRALDLYIVSSRAEGGPEALVEAMACGTPLVTSGVGMAPDIIKHGENGFITVNGTAEDLARLAGEVITEVDRAEYEKTAVPDAQIFDWRRIAQRYYDEMYVKLLE